LSQQKRGSPHFPALHDSTTPPTVEKQTSPFTFSVTIAPTVRRCYFTETLLSGAILVAFMGGWLQNALTNETLRPWNNDMTRLENPMLLQNPASARQQPLNCSLSYITFSRRCVFLSP